MREKEESFISSRKLKSYVSIYKTDAVGGITFASESPEFGTEVYHYSF